MSVVNGHSDFFSIKQPKRTSVVLPEPVDADTVSWKSIRPTNSYETVRKMFIQEQKKRKYAEYKRQQMAEIQETGGSG